MTLYRNAHERWSSGGTFSAVCLRCAVGAWLVLTLGFVSFDLGLAQDTALSFGIESERNISSVTTPGGSGHGATIAQTTSGVILAAWWSGPERAPETDIWMSRFINGTWSAPYRVFDGEEVGSNYTCENCMLFQPENGPLMLFVLVGPAASKKPGDNTIYYHNLCGYLKTSTSDGQTWSAPRALGHSASIDGGNLIGPTKNSPIQLPDGTILVASSNEYGLLESRNWGAFTFHFEESIDKGRTWQFVQRCNKAADLATSQIIQPGFLLLGGSNLMVLGRDNTPARNGFIPFSVSSDNGQTWSTIAEMSTLKHNKSAICPLTLSNGVHVCFVNRYPNSTERGTLDLMVSTAGTNWRLGLAVNSESDGYEAHYPQAVQAADGKLHVVYTYNIKGKAGVIRHAIISISLLHRN